MTAIQDEQRPGRDPAGIALERLVERFDPSVFDVGRPLVRIRVQNGGAPHDVVLEDGAARLERARGAPDAVLSADANTWNEIAEDIRSGMQAFRRGRLKIRRDLHLGVGFLAATALPQAEGRLRLRRVETAAGALSTIEAGTGEPVLLLHGLGATKASFLPTIDALAPTYRAIGVDLPGFGQLERDAAAHAVADHVGEFLRSYLTPLGRAAFYAAARNIYLEEPRGPDGLWTRLGALRPEALFVWGRKDIVVPVGFARHVREELPAASHLELDCGHVPQLERPRRTHRAVTRFLATGSLDG